MQPVLQRFHEIGSLKEQQVFLIAYVKTIRVEDNKEPNANPQYRTRLMEMVSFSIYDSLFSSAISNRYPFLS